MTDCMFSLDARFGENLVDRLLVKKVATVSRVPVVGETVWLNKDYGWLAEVKEVQWHLDGSTPEVGLRDLDGTTEDGEADVDLPAMQLLKDEGWIPYYDDCKWPEGVK